MLFYIGVAPYPRHTFHFMNELSMAPQRPSRALLWLENTRALNTLNTLPYAYPFLRTAPKGDGHHVVVVPGFLANDLTTLPLRLYLNGQGYQAHGWGLGINFGRKIDPEIGIPPDSQLLALVKELYEESGRPVSLIGWSLGGHYSRFLAQMIPEQVRTVITMASPFNGDHRASNVWKLFERISGLNFNEVEHNLSEQLRRPLAMPSTAFFSRTDGVAAWQNCIQTLDNCPHCENIEVTSSHNGIGFHPAVFWAIADRLAQPEGEWKPFAPTDWKKHLYTNWYGR